MWRKLSILFSIVVFSAVVSAQNVNFDIQLVNNSKIKLSPGSSPNVVIKLVNNTNEDEQVSLKINTPQGWKCFSALKAIQAPGSKSTVKILSFNIPTSSRAGDYSISIEAYDKQEQKIGVISVPVTIEPKYELSIKVIDGPEYVFASDTFSVQFRIQNLSNSQADIEALLKGTAADEKMSFSLSPDSSVFITRKMKAEKGIIKSIKKNISLTASLANMPEVHASSYHFYAVIPSGDVKFDPYNRYPVQFSTFFVTDNPRGKRVYALMGDVVGQGFLDDKNTKSLKFQFRGPDRRGKPLYGINDEYFIEYNAPKSKFMLGDDTYKLSYLTEYSRYGRGARADHSFNHITVGSFINFPRFYPKTKREISVYAGYSLPDKFRLNVGYLNKLSSTEDVNHLITLNGMVSPFSWANLDWEYALGSVGHEYKQAVKTELKINLKPVRLLYNYTMAEKGFPGYFTDTRYMLANVSIRLSKKMDLGANYNYMHQNTALDTLYASAPFSKNLFFTFNYRVMKDGGLSAGYNFRERQDRMDPMKFYYNENSMRLILNKRISNFGFDLLGEYGNTENLLLPEKERLNDMYLGHLTINYQTSNKLNINGFVSYQESNRYIVKDKKNWLYGASINASISEKMNLFFNYQSSYNMEEYYLDRSLLDGRLSYSPNKKNRVEISSRYNLIKNSLDVKELAFMVKFVHTFDIPVSKKKNIGKLSGKVINKGVQNTEGIVISTGADQAVSDKNGNYSFPFLPAGTYYLMIDYTKAGVNAVSETPAPYQVEILPGKETKFDIGLTLASKITGEIVIVKEVSEDDKTYAEIKNQLGKLMIEAKNGGEVFRILTNEDGKFSFENLRPGQWTVKVYDNGISKEYGLVTDVFTLGLSPGHTEHVEVKIKEKRRRIKFQKSFDNNVLPVFETSNPIARASDQTDQLKSAAKPERTGKTLLKTKEKLTVPDSTLVKEQTKPASLKNTGPKVSSEELEYRVQIGANTGQKLSLDWLSDRFKLDRPIQEDYFNGYYIYTIGSFATINEAQKLRNTLVAENKIAGAFVVTFKEGKRFK